LSHLRCCSRREMQAHCGPTTHQATSGPPHDSERPILIAWVSTKSKKDFCYLCPARLAVPAFLSGGWRRGKRRLGVCDGRLRAGLCKILDHRNSVAQWRGCQSNSQRCLNIRAYPVLTEFGHGQGNRNARPRNGLITIDQRRRSMINSIHLL
jgi:hypothetical protein